MKMYLRSILLLIFTVISWSINAQNDSTNTIIDTVYIQSEPVIINRKVYLYDTVVKPSPNTYFVGFNINRAFAIHQTSALDFQTNIKNYYETQLYFGKTFGKFALSLGMGFSTMNVVSNYTDSYTLKGSKYVQYTDTIDTYFQLVNGVKTPRYVTQTVDKTITYNYQRDTNFTTNATLKYIIVPVKLSYDIAIQKFILKPTIGFGIAILTTPVTLIAENKNTAIANSFCNANIGLDLAYKLSEKWLISLQCQYQATLTSMLKNANSKLENTKTGFDLKYFF